MIKRILIVISVIIGILSYTYLHGRLFHIMYPDKFIGEVSDFVYTVVGTAFAVPMTILYVCIAAIIWPLIGGTINYIAGKEVCSVPDDGIDPLDEGV